MSRLHRLRWIDEQARSRRYPNCGDIARTFEISTRQALRDIEYLKDSMGAPIEFFPRENGYGYTENSYVLPAAFISSGERDELAYLAYRYENSGTEAGIRLARFLERIGALSSGAPRGGSGEPVPTVSLGPEEARCWRTLARAARDRLKVKLGYRDFKGAASERVFHPYKIFENRGRAFVVGFCELRRALRVLSIPRVRDVELQREGFAFVEGYRDSDWGPDAPLGWRAPFEAIILFDRLDSLSPNAFASEHLRDRTFSFRFQRSSDFLSYLLALGDGFEVQRPDWLRKKLRERLARIAQKNS